MEDFNDLVRAAFGSLAREHGMRELRVSDTPAYHSIQFVNERRVVEFYQDARDGYFDARYGDAATIDVFGNLAGSAIESFASYGSVAFLLRGDGILIPDGYEHPYQQGIAPGVVRQLVDGIVRHADEVLGVPEQQDRS